MTRRSHIFSYFIALLSIIFALIFAVSLSAPVYAADSTAQDAVCAGLGAVSGTDGCEGAEGEGTVDNTLATVINVLSTVGAVIAIIMIIVGGLRFITSSGDSGSTTSARNTIIYAVIGLVVIALAQLIVLFVLERAAPTTP